MSSAPIPNGYILLSRKLLDSEIMAKPPLYLKVWIYLLANAQHKDYKGLKRGQLFTSIPKIQEAMSYMVGYRKETPSYKQVRGVLDWLRFPREGTTKDERRGAMIDITKGTHGMIITIVNYDLYQDPKNYEGHSEGHNEGIAKDERRARQGHNINKNDKNDKNDKEKTLVKESVKIDYQNIVEQYHSLCPSLPRVIKLTPKRKTAIKARVNEYDKTTLIDVFKKAEASNFLSGRDGKWRGATFDWILKASNFLKIVEGNYDERPTKNNREKISGTVRGVSQDRGSPKWDHLYEKS